MTKVDQQLLGIEHYIEKSVPWISDLHKDVQLYVQLQTVYFRPSNTTGSSSRIVPALASVLPNPIPDSNCLFYPCVVNWLRLGSLWDHLTRGSYIWVSLELNFES